MIYDPEYPEDRQKQHDETRRLLEEMAVLAAGCRTLVERTRVLLARSRVLEQRYAAVLERSKRPWERG